MSRRASLKPGKPGLAGAEHLAFAAQAQILLGDPEAVLGLAHHLEPRLGGRPERALVEEEAGRGARAAADAAAELVELGEAEALGVLDHHHGRGRARRRRPRSPWSRRGSWSRRGRSAPWRRPCRARRACRGRGRPRRRRCCFSCVEALLGGREVERLGFARRAGRPSRRGRRPRWRGRARRPPRRGGRPRSSRGRDRLAAGRLLVEHRDVHVAEIGERQRARDRRRGHHQDVDRLALGAERQALVDAEAVLLVDDREAEIAEGDALLEQRVGADRDVDRCRRRAPPGPPRRSAPRSRPVSSATVEARRRGERRDALEMLAGEDLGRRHQRRLPPGLDGARHGEQRRPRSCPSPRRPGAGAACACRRRGRGGCPRPPRPASAVSAKGRACRDPLRRGGRRRR